MEENQLEIASNPLLKLAYRHYNASVSTSTQPPFLLVHGLASAARIWDFVAEGLVEATGAEVVALDQRGHGRSDKPDTGYDTAQIVQDDYTLVQKLGLEKPVIVGHSWGGSIALAYAATYPTEVSGLVLVDGGLGNMRDRFEDGGWERVARELAPPNFAGTPKEQYLGYFKGNPWLAPLWNEQLEDMVLNIVQLSPDNTVGPRLSRANHMQILKALWDADNFGWSAVVTCPVLMISAETAAADTAPAADSWEAAKRQGGETMRARFEQSPKVELLVMSETIHDVPLQRPARLVEAIVSFFKRVPKK